jgi:hypothetical protein
VGYRAYDAASMWRMSGAGHVIDDLIDGHPEEA